MDPEIDEATAQQQQMLQLEPLAKGRFAKTEPTIVDGEDVQRLLLETLFLLPRNLSCYICG